MERLRDYQLEMLERLYQAWERKQSVMVQMPTGTGKTHLMAEVIRAASPTPSKWRGEQNGGVLIVAHRRELIEQISLTLDGFEIENGLIVSGKPIDATKRVQVASIQTLARRNPTPDPSPKERGKGKAIANSSLFTLRFSLVIVDEAHHALAETYRMLWEKWPRAKFLGLTATPCRLSGEPFTDLFDILLQSWTIKTFVKKGWLSDMEYVSVRSNSVILKKVAGLSKRGTDGDYQTREAANVLDTPESIEHLYQSYRKYANGKKGIVYAINRDHAQHIAEYYRERGLSCAAIDFKTPATERRQLVDDYRYGKLQILAGCDIFSEGFDVPDVEFIQLARPTLSLSKFMQQLGRGMRVSKGKEKVTILDQVGLYLIFGLPTVERDWQKLFRGELKGKGIPLSARGLPNWAGGEDKLLVNEEMFRVEEYILKDGCLIRKNKEPLDQRPKEIYGKIEIFRENGLYGIKVGTKVTCPATFKRIERLGWRSNRYFALATLANCKTGSEVEKTVITKDGEDLHAWLTGEFLEERDDVFVFRKTEGGRFISLLWDARYDRYYKEAQLVKTGGLAFFANAAGEYSLRAACDFTCRFNGQDVLYNDHITIIGRNLYVKQDEIRHYQIAGYVGESIIVTDRDEWLQISEEGRAGTRYATTPKNMTAIPLLRQMRLQREPLKQVGGGIKPRDYQEEMLDRLDRAFMRSRRVVLQTPTGSGKSFIALRTIRQETSQGGAWQDSNSKDILIVAHRPEVTGQISQVLDSTGLRHKVLEETDIQNDDYEHIIVVSANNVMALADKTAHYYEPSLIVIDEVHSVGTNILKKLKSAFPSARMLGLTATPYHENGPALGKVFGRMVSSWSIRTLIDKGWLRNVNVVVGKSAMTKGGTVNAESLYKAYKKEVDGRKGIVFASDDTSAKSIADCYQRHGIGSAVIGFDVPKEQCDKILDGYEVGELKVLVCTDYFSDGMRCPDVDFIQLSCPTNSLNTYLHQVGCGMRPEKNEEHANDGNSTKFRQLTVLDHAGLSKTFGLPTADRDWMQLFKGDEKKTGHKKRKEKEAKARKEHVKTTPAGHIKWQLRMQLLLGNPPDSQVAARKI